MSDAAQARDAATSDGARAALEPFQIRVDEETLADAAGLVRSIHERSKREAVGPCRGGPDRLTSPAFVHSPA